MNAREICHHYAAQPDRDRKSGNVSIRDGTLYSYNAPIARLTGNPALPLLMSSRTYSRTTAKHIRFAAQALHHIRPVMDVHNPAASATYQHAENLSHFIRDGIASLKAAGAPRIKEATRARQIAAAIQCRDNAELYRTTFKLPLSALDNETKTNRATLAKLSPETAAQALETVRRAEAAAEKRREKARAEQSARWVKQEAEQAERNAAALAAWIAGERETPPHRHEGETRLRVRGGNVETSHGASVPAADALRLWPLAERARRTGETYTPTGRHAVGIFTLDHVSRQGARIGCHFIPYDEMERIRPEVEAAAARDAEAAALATA